MTDDYDAEEELRLSRERVLNAEKKLADLRRQSREAAKPTATRQTLASVVAKNNQRRMAENGKPTNAGDDTSGKKKSVLHDAVSRLNMGGRKEPQAVNGSRAKLRDIIDKSQAKRA